MSQSLKKFKNNCFYLISVTKIPVLVFCHLEDVLHRPLHLLLNTLQRFCHSDVAHDKLAGRETSLVVQWLRRHVSPAGGLSSLPGQGPRFHMPQLRLMAAKWINNKKKPSSLVVTSSFGSLPSLKFSAARFWIHCGQFQCLLPSSLSQKSQCRSYNLDDQFCLENFLPLCSKWTSHSHGTYSLACIIIQAFTGRPQ